MNRQVGSHKPDIISLNKQAASATPLRPRNQARDHSKQAFGRTVIDTLPQEQDRQFGNTLRTLNNTVGGISITNQNFGDNFTQNNTFIDNDGYSQPEIWMQGRDRAQWLLRGPAAHAKMDSSLLMQTFDSYDSFQNESAVVPEISQY